MELIIAIVVAFPVGYLIKNRTVGYLAFVAVHGYVFTFQTLNEIVEWSGGSNVFGPYPKGHSSEVWAYGIVNLIIFAVSLGLVYLGQRLAARRSRRRNAVSLDATRVG